MATHLNLHLLRLFAAVVEHRGFSRAADALFVTQSAVSKGVRELERQLDLALLDRSSTDGGRRGVRLTDAGEALYRHARALFAMEKAALEDVRDRVGLHRGRLRIGASTTVAGYWLPPALARFAAAHPDIALSLQVDNTAGVAEAVAAGGLDVGFVEGAVDDARLRALRWRDEPLQLITADDDPLAGRKRPAASTLSARTWLLREPGSGTRQVAQAWLQAEGISPRRTLEIGSNEAIARAVAEGAGLAILPAVVVADPLAAGRLRALHAPGKRALVRPLFQLELAQRPRPPALEAFLALLD